MCYTEWCYNFPFFMVLVSVPIDVSSLAAISMEFLSVLFKRCLFKYYYSCQSFIIRLCTSIL
uniref:Uncharacterized protein n=1 Tax=Anguilla anguilla TaxID=7936 RepID=A0A0E9T4A8_ANGAN